MQNWCLLVFIFLSSSLACCSFKTNVWGAFVPRITTTVFLTLVFSLPQGLEMTCSLSQKEQQRWNQLFQRIFPQSSVSSVFVGIPSCFSDSAVRFLKPGLQCRFFTTSKHFPDSNFLAAPRLVLVLPSLGCSRPSFLVKCNRCVLEWARRV